VILLLLVLVDQIMSAQCVQPVFI